MTLYINILYFLFEIVFPEDGYSQKPNV